MPSKWTNVHLALVLCSGKRTRELPRSNSWAIGLVLRLLWGICDIRCYNKISLDIGGAPASSSWLVRSYYSSGKLVSEDALPGLTISYCDTFFKQKHQLPGIFFGTRTLTGRVGYIIDRSVRQLSLDCLAVFFRPTFK